MQKYLNLSGHIVVPLLIMMNDKAWVKMNEADHKALLVAFVEGAKVNDGMTRDLEARLADEFKAKGMTIVATDRVAVPFVILTGHPSRRSDQSFPAEIVDDVMQRARPPPSRTASSDDP